MKNIVYATSHIKHFADTANSLQTISNISYLSRNNCNVSLVFPLREKQSTESLKELQNFYDFKEDIKIKGLVIITLWKN